MQKLLAATALVLLAAAAAPATLADHYGGRDENAGHMCPTYDIEHEAADGWVRLQASSREQQPWGSVVLYAGGVYLVEDVAVVNGEGTGYLFSYWTYVETNGIRGLQRADEVCTNCSGDWDSCDSLLFY